MLKANKPITVAISDMMLTKSKSPFLLKKVFKYRESVGVFHRVQIILSHTGRRACSPRDEGGGGSAGSALAEFSLDFALNLTVFGY